MKNNRLVCILLLAIAFVACSGKDTEDMIIGTWDLVSITNQSIGHPDQSLNGRTTETFGEGDIETSLTFGKDNHGYWIDKWYVTDSVYVHDPVTDTICGSYDTNYVVYDTMRFSYFATGNILNMQDRGSNGAIKAFRIDRLDNSALTITDTNCFTDRYTDSRGRSIRFTQETKTEMNFKRR